jgi:hypothetical protein
MVEVFKTNVASQTQANSILISLLKKFPSHKINFDLDDCDKILRVHGKNISVKKVIELVNENGYECEILV